ncbi:restriction endonuclease subunit S [Xenorhabdus sp. XENO-7]|uniref:Restriction endonuclease subunit S n=1 Tax=Xenorhabdus aichiensis TaxID=3025874 RepID=A0ABT5M618_9GAMM|nr:restriction endonuclease subunit S [Xenorhabdus aichiensis]MDC9623153.1 restriction endonuclease subunit S [Xenorhabdus aichiensis]
MSKEKALQPALRFTDFIGDWENKKLGEVVEFFSGLTYSPSDVTSSYGTLVLRSSNVKNGQLAFEDNVYVKSKVVNCSNVKIGDIVVVVRNGSRSLIGKHAPVLTHMPNTVIGAFMTGIRTEQSSFINALLDTSLFNKAVEKNLGATINQITTGAFKEMEFYFSAIEQEKKQIGTFFQKIDQQLKLHQSKYTKLQQLKKSMLGKMFPKAGAKVPEVRFAGFSGDWESKILGEITESYSGGTPTVGISEYYGGEIPFIRSGEIDSNATALYITPEGLNNSSAKLVDKGCVLYALYGATSGEVAISKIHGAINQAILAIKPQSGYTSRFVALSLRWKKQEIINTYLQGGQGNLSGTIIKKLIFHFPSHEEQEKIGHYFQNLDRLIALQQQHINKLKNIKQACLEKMFV